MTAPLKSFVLHCAGWLMFIALSVGAVASTGVDTVDSTTTRFGILAYRPKAETMARWQPVVDYLNRAGLPRRVVLDVLTYSELDAAVSRREVDFVLTQPAHYTVLTYREGLHSPLATLIEGAGPHALSSFGGVILIQAGRKDLVSLRDLHGKRIATVTRGSLGGYQAQAMELQRVGVRMPQDVHLVETGGEHDRAVLALLAGEVDAAFVRTGVFESMVREKKIDPEKFGTVRAESAPSFPLLLSTPLYPEWALAAMPWADPGLARQIAAVVLALPHGGAVAQAAGITGFTVPGDYQAVDRMMRILRVPPFETADFFFADVWNRYRGWILLSLALGVFILLLTVRLAHSRKLLRQNETRFRTLLDGTHNIAVQGYDSERRVLYWNRASETLYGYSRAEALGQRLEDLIIPEAMRARVIAEVESWIAGGLPIPPGALILRNKRGEPVSVYSSHVLQQGLAGPELYCLDVDLSERERAEAAQRASEQWAKGYFDNAPVGIFVAGPEGRYVNVNPAACVMTGYSRDELLSGMGILDLSANPDPVAYLALFSRVIETGRGTFDLQLRRKDGSVFVASLRAVRLENGLVMGFALDMTEQRQAEARLRDSEAHYRALFDDSSIVMLLIDPNTGQIRNANAAAVAYYGYPIEVLRSLQIQQINVMEPGEIASEMVRAKMAGRLSFEFRHRLADGRIRDVLVSSGPIRIDGTTLLLSTVLDVTERRAAEQRMREAMVVFNASSQGIITTDAEGRITDVNPAFTRITGYAREDVLGRSPAILKSGRHDAAFYGKLWSTLMQQGFWEGEVWNRRRDGAVYPEWLTITAVSGAQGGVAEYVAVFSDITERKQHEEVIWRKANYDALTGLANRNLFADRLDRAIAQSRRNGTRVGLAFLDLDGFKWINDSLGHDIGDLLLVEVASRLRGAVREEDTVARLGGDEFTVIIHDLDSLQSMVPVAEKLLAVLREPFLLVGTAHQISGSIGITYFPDDGEDVQSLLKNADIAMYKAKQGGKNRTQFYARHMQVDALARLQMETDLRAGIETQAFLIHYQPIVDADSGELVGAEALLRWRHPQQGLIDPLEFIPVAEDCGLIMPIGEWALRETARQWRRWTECGHSALQVAVNVSGLQFREPSFPQRVREIMDEFAIDPGCLTLEITESVLMDGSREVEERMRAIKSLGVRYALDDFGTGYSSLSYLKRFPVDSVKIDRSFVRDCPHDRNDAHLVEAIVTMAHSLGLRVTAEGVETEAQLEFLRDLGCDTVQGFLIDRALPAESFEILIQREQLLLPTDGASFEESRFLAALRDDSLDVDAWLVRLLGEDAPALTEFTRSEELSIDGLNLREAVRAHLDWRRRLDEFVGGRPGAATGVEHAADPDRCTLGTWLSHQLLQSSPNLLRLEEAHRLFHRMAGEIVEDYRFGHRAVARRALSSLRFRTASRDVVSTLIACFREQQTTISSDDTAV